MIFADCIVFGIAPREGPYVFIFFVTDAYQIISAYASPLLPGFTGLLPALHRGQVSCV